MITVNDIDFAFDNHKQFDLVISLLDKEWIRPHEKDEFMTIRPNAWIVGFFEDDEDPNLPHAPTKGDVLAIFTQWDLRAKHIQDLHNKHVLVHCHGGISRSTAMGIGLLIGRHGFSVAQAIDKMEIIRPQMWPNELIIKHCDEILGLNGHLIKSVADWKESARGKLYWPRPPIRIKPKNKT